MKIKQIKDHQPDKHRHMNFDVFSWTMQEVMGNVNVVMKHLTTSFANKHAAELRDESLEVKGLFFVKYFLKYKRSKMKFNIPESKVTKVKMTEDEEREHIFNRSIDYYSNSQKVSHHDE